MSLLIHPRIELQQQFPFQLVVFNNEISWLERRGSSCCCLARGKKSTEVWDSDRDSELEAEVMEFMKNSKNPNLFPTKEELIDAGRFDLVKSIVKQGGWLSFGWGLDDEEDELEEENGIQCRDRNTKIGEEIENGFLSTDTRIFQHRFYGGETSEYDSLQGSEAVHSEDSSSSSSSSSCTPSSSGRMEGGDDVGIEGILNRLEKQRTRSFGNGSRDKESKVNVVCNGYEANADDQLKILEVRGGGRSSSSASQSSDKDVLDNSGGMHFQNDLFSNNHELETPIKPDMWRKWSNKRAGVSGVEFEAAAEFGEHIIRDDEMVGKRTNETANPRKQLDFGFEENGHDDIRSRLQHLESELDSVLRLLSSQTDMPDSDKVTKNSSEESHSLSDAWEFRETKIMKARDKLRSLRAQLAVVEGKMALRIIDAQKRVEVKQRKIHVAREALSLLRTACIVWPNSASEVLLVGSFDGWTSQRKMQQTSPGIFSLYLRLYPGRYEFKFIVDGEWTIDPLRPIVNNNGHQNNLIIIS
ncbi:Ptst-like protein [Thalictrum thalictroides]|uniref:Ptst-like protein n=1 Tax=Thalictrum thalictroides TaxID=46969 RepID=A0A7J6WL84_THATH|nr:Ptst-like protein [Thalictrum thalictroides]